MESGGNLLLGDGSLPNSLHVRHTGIHRWSRLGALRRRNAGSAICKTFQISVVADSIRLERLPTVVRRRTAAKGDSTTFVVRRCDQCLRGNR